MNGTLKYRIPYTTAFKNTGAGANGYTNITIQLSQQYGKRLKRIIHTVFNPQEKFNTAYDCNNRDGIKIASYQTWMDSLPLQDRILSCKLPAAGVVGMDDWAENRKYMDKRSIYLSKEHYQTNWFHMDQFFEPLDLGIPEVNVDEGLPLDSSKQWVFQAQNGPTAGLMHYTFAEFSRDVMITDAGPIWL